MGFMLILLFFFLFQVDLTSFINKSGSECLNGADDYPFTNCLEKNGNYLESDCDEQVNIKFYSTRIYTSIFKKFIIICISLT